jgi:hypothetical protein
VLRLGDTGAFTEFVGVDATRSSDSGGRVAYGVTPPLRASVRPIVGAPDSELRDVRPPERHASSRGSPFNFTTEPAGLQITSTSLASLPQTAGATVTLQ